LSGPAPANISGKETSIRKPLPVDAPPHGFRADSQGRTAFVNHVELEYEKTGIGTLIEWLAETACRAKAGIRTASNVTPKYP
jgi:hypothetical protein